MQKRWSCRLCDCVAYVSILLLLSIGCLTPTQPGHNDRGKKRKRENTALEEGLKAIQQSMNEQMGGIKLMVADLLERQSNHEARTSGDRARSLSGTIGGANGIPSPRLSQNTSILISEASREEHSDAAGDDMETRSLGQSIPRPTVYGESPEIDLRQQYKWINDKVWEKVVSLRMAPESLADLVPSRSRWYTDTESLDQPISVGLHNGRAVLQTSSTNPRTRMDAAFKRLLSVISNEGVFLIAWSHLTIIISHYHPGRDVHRAMWTYGHDLVERAKTFTWESVLWHYVEYHETVFDGRLILERWSEPKECARSLHLLTQRPSYSAGPTSPITVPNYFTPSAPTQLRPNTQTVLESVSLPQQQQQRFQQRQQQQQQQQQQGGTMPSQGGSWANFRTVNACRKFNSAGGCQRQERFCLYRHVCLRCGASEHMIAGCPMATPMEKVQASGYLGANARAITSGPSRGGY